MLPTLVLVVRLIVSDKFHLHGLCQRHSINNKQETGLLNEKGIHHEPAAKKSTEDSHTSKNSASGDKEKVSLSEKIKDKLHIHKH